MRESGSTFETFQFMSTAVSEEQTIDTSNNNNNNNNQQTTSTYAMSQWSELLTKDEHFFQTYRGRYQCSKLLYGSNAAERLPLHCRWIMWSRFLQLPSFVSEELPVNYYDTLLNSASFTEIDNETSKNVKQILLDIPRTCNSGEISPEAHQQMFHVLYALVLFQPKVGYCQGMSYICAHVLSVMESEEDAFLMMVALMNKYDMKSLFQPGFPKLKSLSYVFENLFQQLDPKLYNHLQQLGISPDLYIPRWYLSMFCTQFPQVFVLRVWDLFLLYGWVVIHQVALSLITFHRKELLECVDIEAAMNIIQSEIPKSVSDPSVRHKVFYTCTSKFRERDMKRLETEYENIVTQAAEERVEDSDNSDNSDISENSDNSENLTEPTEPTQLIEEQPQVTCSEA